MPRSFLIPGLLLLTLGVASCGTKASGQEPAATVNGHDISMSSYNKQFAYKRVVSTDTTGFDTCQTKSTKALCDQIKKSALNKLIQDEIANEYAARHHITVSQAEFDRQWAIINQKSFHNQTRVLKAYTSRYGWAPADLKASIREDLLRQKVMFAVTKKLSPFSPAVRLSRLDVANAKQAQGVKAALRAGTSFDLLASKLNKNKKSLCVQVRQGCGDVGWVPNSLVPVQERSVLSAKVGQVVGPFVSQQFQEFLHLTGRNPHYHMTNQQQYNLREQLFVIWLTQQQSKASITRHLKV